jgi:alpha-ketoglutarate-dependent taurine dioxygenase
MPCGDSHREWNSKGAVDSGLQGGEAVIDIPIFPWGGEEPGLSEALWSGAGCAVVRGVPVNSDQAQELYMDLASRLGRVVPQTVSGTMIYSVRDEGYQLDRDFGKAGVRTSKTTSAFGFHTDSPSRLAGHTPDAIGLLVLQTAKSGGESVFVDGRAVYRTMAEERKHFLERLCEPFWVDRRAELPPGEAPYLPVPVFAVEPEFRVRYVRLYIEKGHELAGSPLSGDEVAALDYFDTVCARLAVTMELQRGDIQFLNNVTHLHGRSSYEDYPEPERKRHYLRIWVERDH